MQPLIIIIINILLLITVADLKERIGYPTHIMLRGVTRDNEVLEDADEGGHQLQL